ncbi:MaoC/PaaZ C-terminal domain-containing protein [Pseudonocardia spinosispora]|uniref:MaoC/PaaZ C-terminal domain-containing protein n=1 Tax=Pseudonocardia spinosispora TaxID=103441 RepID=UPI00040C8E8B|nr:MaoC/PaaZ C-terminal domain-containing protein [Pseudonocardia spinosispora]
MATENLTTEPRLGSRYALALLPWRGGGGGELPDRELALDGLTVDPGRLADYARVCGFPLDGRLPTTFPQVLSFGPQVQLMTEPGFPLRLPGLVHLRQRITVHRPIGADERLDLRVRAADLRPHAKGTQVDLLSSVTVSGEEVWSAVSTYLSRGTPTGTAEAEREPAEVPDAPLAARWHLAGDTGRRYAAVSGDVNPIHLHPLAAKAFGFPGAIAHGMWTAARCLATLQGRLPEAYDLDVVFRKPVVLPSDVQLHVAHATGTWALALRSTDRLHLLATVTPR